MPVPGALRKFSGKRTQLGSRSASLRRKRYRRFREAILRAFAVFSTSCALVYLAYTGLWVSLQANKGFPTKDPRSGAQPLLLCQRVYGAATARRHHPAAASRPIYALPRGEKFSDAEFMQ